MEIIEVAKAEPPNTFADVPSKAPEAEMVGVLESNREVTPAAAIDPLSVLLPLPKVSAAVPAKAPLPWGVELTPIVMAVLPRIGANPCKKGVPLKTRAVVPVSVPLAFIVARGVMDRSTVPAIVESAPNGVAVPVKRITEVPASAPAPPRVLVPANVMVDVPRIGANP
jgi:hypothetical protein